MTYKRTFTSFAIGVEFLGWNRVIEIKTYMNLGFLRRHPDSRPSAWKGLL
ncbi:MAG: hypothetical protein ABIN18_29310 [Pseudomonadota bacterium]